MFNSNKLPTIQYNNMSANKKWRQSHPLQISLNIDHSNGGILIPDFLGKFLVGFISSSHQNTQRELAEQREKNFNKDLFNRLHEHEHEDRKHWNFPCKSDKGEDIRKPQVVQLSPIASFVNELFELKKITPSATLHYPLNPSWKGSLGMNLKFDPVMKLDKVVVGVVYTPKGFPIGLQPYYTISTKGSKHFGITIIIVPKRGVNSSESSSFQRSDESSGLSEESLSEKNPSPNSSSSEGNQVNSSSSEGNQANIHSFEKSQIGPTSSVRKGCFEKIGNCLDNTSIHLKDTSKYLRGKIDKESLQVALFRSVTRDKLGYICVAIVLIFIRIVATRVKARGEIDGLNENSKRYKFINFIISWSTQNSSLALSFFCFPIASHLTNLLVGSVVVFVKAINSQVLFCWFVRFIPFGEIFIELL